MINGRNGCKNAKRKNYTIFQEYNNIIPHSLTKIVGGRSTMLLQYQNIYLITSAKRKGKNMQRKNL